MASCDYELTRIPNLDRKGHGIYIVEQGNDRGCGCRQVGVGKARQHGEGGLQLMANMRNEC